MLLTYKNEIAILYSGECRNTYFEIKRSGGNDEQNNKNRKKTIFSAVKDLLPFGGIQEHV